MISVADWKTIIERSNNEYSTKIIKKSESEEIFNYCEFFTPLVNNNWKHSTPQKSCMKTRNAIKIVFSFKFWGGVERI